MDDRPVKTPPYQKQTGSEQINPSIKAVEIKRFESFQYRSSATRNSQQNKEQNKTNSQKIQSTRNQLDDLIGDLNSKLTQHFHRKQQQLLSQYKQELINAQKELNVLKQTTNEETIKQKMMERKKALEKQRHELIQTNMYFSNKCEEFKKKLSQLVMEGKQLQKQAIYLSEQINTSKNRKDQIEKSTINKAQAQGQRNLSVSDNGQLPIFSDKKIDIPQNINLKKSNSTYARVSPIKNVLNSSSTAKTQLKNRLLNAIASSQKKKQLMKKLNWNIRDEDQSIAISSTMNHSITKRQRQIPPHLFEKTPLQSLFQKTVAEVKATKKQKKTLALGINRGEQFTDIQKKQIMQKFLGQEEVKKKIYEIIFDQVEDTSKGFPQISIRDPSSKKPKINFDDLI